VRERDRGLSLAVAIERVTAEPSGPPSLFAPLRERRPDLTFVLATFETAGRPDGGPVEVPIHSGEPVADEWAVICLAPGYSACLIGWETVGATGQADGERTFDALLSVEPSVVREVAGAAVGIAAEGEPQVAARARAYLDRIPDSSQRSQLRLAGAITARAFSRM
jgi:hypothetical protein